LFYDYELIQRGWIKKKTVSSFIPIFTGLMDKEDASKLVEWLKHSHFCGNKGGVSGGSFCHVPTIPSIDINEPYFHKINYWRGPIWINTNWMIWQSLLKYGYREAAEDIRSGIFDLVKNHGFREYYNPYTGDGLGGKNFSWTASLVMDMIKRRSS
jgi:neutral trehalase